MNSTTTQPMRHFRVARDGLHMTGMNRLRSESGMTLTELMIVVVLGGFSLTMAMGFLLNSSGNANSFAQSVDAEVDELRAAMMFRTVFGQAIELLYFGDADLNTFADDGKGRVRKYDSDTEFGTTPTTRTLAVFARDKTPSNRIAAAGVATDLEKTAVYFQKPTPMTWGVLYFNLGNGLTLKPTKADQIFEGLTRVQLMNVTTYDPDANTPTVGKPVTGFDVKMTFRRFFGDVKPELRTFCPQAFLTSDPSCKAGPHRDVTRTVRVIALDNTLQLSPSGPRGAKLYDLIHFFGLNKEGGLR